jgi:sarcosine oxidase delta subunit
MDANVSLPPGKGPYCFRIYDMVYHRKISVVQNSSNPAYADLYFMDSAQATDLKLHNQENAGCERWLMLSLDTMLREINPYALLYKSLRQVFEEE